MHALLPPLVKHAVLVVIGDIFLLDEKSPCEQGFHPVSDLLLAVTCYELKWKLLAD